MSPGLSVFGLTWLAREMDFCDDFADEGLEFGWGRGDLEGFAEHLLRVRRGGLGLR